MPMPVLPNCSLPFTSLRKDEALSKTFARLIFSNGAGYRCFAAEIEQVVGGVGCAEDEHEQEHPAGAAYGTQRERLQRHGGEQVGREEDRPRAEAIVRGAGGKERCAGG